jgi:hypothetical protein
MNLKLTHYRKFAGDDISLARYYPEDDEFLLDKPRHVTHATVVFLDIDRDAHMLA